MTDQEMYNLFKFPLDELAKTSLVEVQFVNKRTGHSGIQRFEKVGGLWRSV